MGVSMQVRNFIIKNFLFEDSEDIEDDMSFLENGIIDSTGVLELIEFIEQNFKIKIEDQEIVPENLDSVSRVAAFIQSKLGAPALQSANLN